MHVAINGFDASARAPLSATAAAGHELTNGDAVRTVRDLAFRHFSI